MINTHVFGCRDSWLANGRTLTQSALWSAAGKPTTLSGQWGLQTPTAPFHRVLTLKVVNNSLKKGSIVNVDRNVSNFDLIGPHT